MSKSKYTELEQMDIVAGQTFSYACKVLTQMQEVSAPFCGLLEDQIHALDRGRSLNVKRNKIICDLYKRSDRVGQTIQRIAEWFRMEYAI